MLVAWCCWSITASYYLTPRTEVRERAIAAEARRSCLRLHRPCPNSSHTTLDTHHSPWLFLWTRNDCASGQDRSTWCRALRMMPKTPEVDCSTILAKKLLEYNKSNTRLEPIRLLFPRDSKTIIHLPDSNPSCMLCPTLEPKLKQKSVHPSTRWLESTIPPLAQNAKNVLKVINS
jgi:hypothetical protein